MAERTELKNTPLLQLISGFIQELRAVGLPLSLTENLDAMEAVMHIPLEDRDSFKYALGGTLVKSHSHWEAFETVFEIYFSLRGSRYDINADDRSDNLDLDTSETENNGPESAMAGQGFGGNSVDPAELAKLLYQAILSGDRQIMRGLARMSVIQYAGMEPGRPVGGTYYLYRILRNLDLEGLLDRIMEQVQAEPPRELSPLEKRLRRNEFEDRIEKLKEEIETEIRRRLVADRGVAAMAKTLRKPLPEDIDFMHATRDEIVLLRRAIWPLTRKLAARLTQKRRHGRKGPLDFRNTVRHSLSYGGVPAEPKFRQSRPSKPEIMVIADISGSVAAFARFTLHLVYALNSQFSKVRSFVFIDGLDEVTSFFEGADDIVAAIHRVNTESEVIWVDGHSDYGHAFEVFHETYGNDVGKKTTILVLGDARNNYHAPESWVIKDLQEKARKLFWLNPEPRSYWDTGDSIVGEYGKYCDGVYEVRNLRQLESFVERLV